MKRKITFLIFIFSIYLGWSQSYEWGLNIGGWVNDQIVDIDRTADGIIVTTNVAVFQDLKGLYKYDADGNLIWKFTFFDIDSSYDYGFSSVETDENGYIYALLSFGSNAVSGSVIVNSVDIYYGMSLVKIDPDGDILWSKPISGAHGSSRISLKNNRIYVIGNFLENLHINNEVHFKSKKFWDCISLIYRNGIDIFIAKFDTIGNLLEANTFGDDFDDFFIGVTIDDDEDIYFNALHGRRSCSITYSYIHKINPDLKLEWTKTVCSNENGSGNIYPTNIYVSETEKLFFWGYNLDTVVTDDFTIDKEIDGADKASLIEYDPKDGSFVRLNSYVFGTWNGIFSVSGHASVLTSHKGYMQDHKGKLLVFTSSTRPIQFDNHLFTPKEKQENLLLYSVDLQTFGSEYITHFEGEFSNQYAESSTDRPGPILIDQNYLYITGGFQSNPLYVFGNSIQNNSGNNNTDILITKLNVTDIIDPNKIKDTDNDGVLDYKDFCAETPLDEIVDRRGCSETQNDNDEDGIVNSNDLCPETEVGQLPDENGCSLSQKDTDTDGVNDLLDLCPDTPTGTVVDYNGCEPFTLPFDNFTLVATSETCKELDNGSIVITAINATFNYRVSLNRQDIQYNFTDLLEITDLTSGVYEVCIGVENIVNFKRCFEIILEEPEDLKVNTKVNQDQRNIILNLNGGNTYTIIHNDKKFESEEPQVVIDLIDGMNTILVKTDKECQGVYKENVMINKKALLYPNPFRNHLSIHLKDVQDAQVTVNVYSVSGLLLTSDEFEVSTNKYQIDTSNLSKGIYFVEVNTKSIVKTFKVIKK